MYEENLLNKPGIYQNPPGIRIEETTGVYSPNISS